MIPYDIERKTTLSIVIPCYNEEFTLEECVRRVLAIEDEKLSLEIVIVDDKSKDNSLAIARGLAEKHPQVQVVAHEKNQGKGAALRTGFQQVTGEIVAVQDADLEYNPMELRKLIRPILADKADVVFGSRFLTNEEHRVLYFWHGVVNKSLTLLSNMFTDINLTDMETCYKVFRKEIIQSITIEENRFGFEPEIVAKVAQLRPRIYEIGISYSARTYEEGKKIKWQDGVRALYCIFHYNAPKAPFPIQTIIYFFIGGLSAVFNVLLFLLLLKLQISSFASASIAYLAAAALNYLLCIELLFRHQARWKTFGEIVMYTLVVVFSGIVDVASTQFMILGGMDHVSSKSIACVVVFILNFLGRKYLVFPEKPDRKSVV